MKCGQCGAANRDGARFCSDCGSPLVRACASCGGELGADARFCDQCGTPVLGAATGTAGTGAPAAPAPASRADTAVRKTVTVLFADLGGSTGFGERVDPEVARQVLARYHALLQDGIDAHGGTVAKFMGDGMMATFGIPEIAEDDAHRAVRAGIAIQARFEQFAGEVASRHGEALTMRVGINTGEVVIAAGDADMVGDALNVAARLEKACRPGHVLVGEETWRITRGELAYEPLGAVTVAGRAQPVATFEVAASEVAAAEPVAPFVGRDEELHRLQRALARAQAEHSAVLVTVLGSPGVGKTRLSRELGLYAETADGARAFEIRCDRAGTATFAPIAELLRDVAGLDDENDADPDGTRTRERLGALLGVDDADGARVVDVLAGVLGAAPARSVEETFWAIRKVLEALARVHPLVIVIDDIQWAEPKLLDLLEHLAEWVANAAVLLVGLARPELRELRPSMTEPGRRVADVLALDGLDVAATEALAAGLLGSALPRELVERLPTSTDGNPLFVRELVRMLVDDGVIQRRDDGTWALAIDVEAVDVPPTIQSLLGARVERLPADELRVLELASVIGAEFSIGALRDLVGDELPVAALLERMRRQELVEPTGTYWGDEPVHRFHHVLIRDAAYRRLLKTTRAELHRRVGEWTDASAATLIGEHEAAIAFHYEQAHRYRAELGSLDDETDAIGRRAAALLTIASQRSLDRDDLAAAGALARRALAVLPPADTADRSALLVTACECALASGDVGVGAPLVDQLVAIAGRNEQLAAWGDCFRAQLIGLTDPEGLVAADARATAAAETLTRLGDGAGEAKAHQVRAGLLARLGRVGEAEAVLDLALSAARTVDDRRRVTAVLGAAPVAALFGPSPVARAGGRCLDVVRLLRITTASPSVEATSMRCQAVLEALRGRFDVSRSMLAAARESLEELGLTHGLLETDLFAGMVEVIAGETAAAVAPLRAAYEGLGALGVGADAGQAGALLARALLELGHIDEADLAAQESEAVAGQNLKTAIAWRIARAEVHAARGDVDAGVALAEEAVRIAAATDLVLDHADACVALADLRSAARDAAGARAARADALRLYEAKGATVPAARVSDAASTSEVPVRASVRVSEPAAPSREGDTRTAVAENTATRFLEQLRVALNAGDYEAAGRLTADGYVFEDRRSIVAVPDVDALTSDTQAATAQGFVILEPEVVAVRGERLCLRRLVYRTPEGDESPRLVVDELDANGQLARSVFFDEDDMTVALAELDVRFYLGEGAPFQRVLQAAGRYAAASDAGDLDGMRDHLAEDFVVVDRQPLGFGEGDREYFVEMRRLAETDLGGVNAVFHLNEYALLAVYVSKPITDQGSRYERSGCVVMGIDDSDRVNRLEMYGDDDFGAALARLDELGVGVTADARTPFAENVASRFMEKLRVAFNGQDREVLARLIARGYVHEDRRPIVSTVGLDPQTRLDDLDATIDQGFTFAEPVTIAVRGERLALSRMVARTADGYESARLSVNELDEDGRMARSVLFDDDDLVGAIAELDRAYFLGEGAPFQRVLAAVGRYSAAYEERDDKDRLAPDFVLVDHQPLGFGVGDRDYFLEMERVDQTEGRGVNCVLYVNEHALLAVNAQTPIGQHGSRYERSGCVVMGVDATDRINRIEMYADDEFAAALARLDELGAASPADPRTAQAENATTRLIARTLDLMNRGDWDTLASMNVAADDVVRFDRRRTVSAPTLTDSESFGANAAGIYQVFGVVHPEPVAVRGERLALIRLHCGEPPAFTMQLLVVYELDDAGRIVREVDFDDDDLVNALTELDARHSAGGGAALVRLDELGAEVPAPPRTLENATTRVLDEFFELLVASHFDEAEALMDPAFEHLDRRSIVSNDSVGRDETMVNNRAIVEMGFDRVELTPVAIRGERLALVRGVFRTAAGDELPLLMVQETNAQGLRTRYLGFDPEDLDAALEELDERFIAGEGAEHEYLIRRIGDFRHARGARDWDAVEALFSPDYIGVDRRPLGLGTGTRSGYLAASRAMVELVPDATFVPRAIEVSADVVLLRTAGSGTSVDGSRSEWEQWVVWRFAGGRVVRGEVFALEAEAAARARFAELAAQTLTPYIDNHLVRISVRGQWLGRFTDERPGFYRDDCVLDDRRPGVNAGTVHGAEPVRSSIQSGLDVFGVLEIDWLAVRGDRLALNRWAFVAEGGFEAPGVSVIELDENDLVSRVTSFDENDLAEAIELLEHRHVELAGDTITPQELTTAVGSRAFNARGWDAMAGVFGRDLRFVTHAPFTTEGGWDDYLAQLRLLVEQVPDVAVVYAKVTTRGRCGLSLLPFTGTTPEGSRYSWSMVQVTRMGTDGRIAEFELFDIEQWDDAVVLFRQWSAESLVPTGAEPTTSVENTASRRTAEAAREFAVEGGAASEHVADDVLRVDHRRMIGVPTTTTRQGFADAARAFADVGMKDLRFDVVAVRGDRCCLGRLTYSGAYFDVRFLTVVGCDEHDKMARIDNFDEDDLAAALDTLDERFIAGEGAEHRNVIRWWREFGAAYRDRDWAALEDLFAPDAVLVDHRSIGQGWTTRADFLTSTRAVVELVPDVQHLPQRLEIRGRVTLTDGEAFGTTSDGSKYTWGYHLLAHWAGGRITRLEIFDADEGDAARARFEDLANETEESRPDNAAVRLIVDASRLLWTDLDAALDRFSPDAIGAARESGPSLGLSAQNREMWRDVLGSLADTYDDVRYETLAVRGDRLALLRQEFVADGYVTPALLVVETDEHDRILRLETFAEEDLPVVIEGLDQRASDLLGE